MPSFHPRRPAWPARRSASRDAGRHGGAQAPRAEGHLGELEHKFPYCCGSFVLGSALIVNREWAGVPGGGAQGSGMRCHTSST